MHLSSSEKFWRALTRAVGREELLDDQRFGRFQDRMIPAHYATITAIMEAEFIKLPRAEWERRLSEADVPFAPALTMHEVAAHPQTQWLGMMEQSDNGRTLVRPPWRFDGDRPHRAQHAPHIGEHTSEVLAEVLSAAELDALLAGGTAFVRQTAA